jgi:hypothetical protein
LYIYISFFIISCHFLDKIKIISLKSQKELIFQKGKQNLRRLRNEKKIKK